MPWLPKRKIVVPVDFSDRSFAAIDVAVDMVDDPSNVLVVYVLRDEKTMSPGEMWGTVTVDTRKAHVTTALQERLAKTNHANLAIEIGLGDPGHVVAELAERENADLIVLTSHGRTGIKRILIGSVAERVTRLAHCPVLVLRD